MREDTVEKFENRLFILEDVKSVMTDLFVQNYFADDFDRYSNIIHVLETFEHQIQRKLNGRRSK